MILKIIERDGEIISGMYISFEIFTILFSHSDNLRLQLITLFVHILSELIMYQNL